jgi:FAS-associated factor 2
VSVCLLIYNAAAAKLREEQDKDYLESLRRDQEREREFERQIQEQQDEEELKAALEYSVQLKQESTLERLTKQLPAEPPANTKESTTEIAVRLPDGSREQRKFFAFQKLKDLKTYIDILLVKLSETSKDKFDLGQLDTYKIVSSFPKKTFTDLEQTFTAADLVPRALVNIEL